MWNKMPDWDIDIPIHKATTEMYRDMKNGVVKTDYTLPFHFIALLS